MSDLPKVYLSSLASFHQFLVSSMHSDWIQVSLISRHNHQPWGGTVNFMILSQARLTGLLGPSILPYVNDFIKLSKLPLSVAPYSIAPSNLVDWLWSLVCSFLSFFFCLFRKNERSIYWWFLEHPLLNARTCGTSWLASFLNKSVASSLVHFSSYIYISPPPLISLISSLLILRERARHFVNSASIDLLISSHLLPSFCWDRHFLRNDLLIL